MDSLNALYSLNCRKRFMSATINVINATNLTSSVKIRGYVGSSFDLHETITTKPRSYALICTKTDAKSKSRKRHLIEVGDRLSSGFIVRGQNERSHKGKLTIDFYEPLVKFTYISVAANVRNIYNFEIS